MAPAIATACLCFVAIPSALILASSFASLNTVDYALDFDAITMAINPTTYTSAGLYFLGFAHSFIIFPRTIQTIEFESDHRGLLHTRTADGLPLTLGVSFQYRYMPEHLINLYVAYRGEHEDVYINTAIAAIANIACNYTAYAFFNDKQGIAQQMQHHLNDVFREGLYAHVEAFQISRVELPDIFQDAIVHSIATKQNITQTLRYKDNMAVTFQTQVMVANQTLEMQVLAANGTASARLERAAANARITQQTVQAEMSAYDGFARSLGLTPAELLDYLWWNQLQDDAGRSVDAKEFLVGVNPAAYISKA